MWGTVVRLGQSVGPLVVGPGLSLVLDLAFRSTFSLHQYLPQLDIVGRALILPGSEVLDFVDSPWEALALLKSG